MAAKFPKKSPNEIKLCSFDFSTEAVSGTTLSAPVVSKEWVSGTADDDADSITLGTPQVVGYAVKILVGGGLDAARYRLTAKVDADNGERHEIPAVLPIAAG
jgi:hypothetical protein